MDIIKVKMVKDCYGSPDGCYICNYSEGETYDLPSDLANAFLSMEVAKKAKPVKVEVSAEDSHATVEAVIGSSS